MFLTCDPVIETTCTGSSLGPFSTATQEYLFCGVLFSFSRDVTPLYAWFEFPIYLLSQTYSSSNCLYRTVAVRDDEEITIYRIAKEIKQNLLHCTVVQRSACKELWSVKKRILSMGCKDAGGRDMRSAWDSGTVHEDNCGWEEVVFMRWGFGLYGPQPPAGVEGLQESTSRVWGVGRDLTCTSARFLCLFRKHIKYKNPALYIIHCAFR